MNRDSLNVSMSKERRNPYEIQVNTKAALRPDDAVHGMDACRNPYEIQVNTKLR